jgi:hypothetical protein
MSMCLYRRQRSRRAAESARRLFCLRNSAMRPIWREADAARVAADGLSALFTHIGRLSTP